MVTGTGFVGSYVVRDLLAAGEKVVLYGYFGGRGEPATTDLPDLGFLDYLVGGDLFDKVGVVVGDIADPDALKSTVEAHDVDSVVHLASMVAAASEANAPAAVRVNAGGTVNLFETAAQLKLRKVVWASSVTVFGPRSEGADGVISDDSLLDPDGVYGASKVFSEHLAQRYHENFGLESVGLRLSRVYGFGEHVKAGRGSGTTWLLEALHNAAVQSGTAEFLFGDMSLDFHYVEDVAEAFLQALAGPALGAPSYLTHGDYRPIAEAYGFLRELLPDADMKLSGSDADLPAGSTMAWARRYDASRAEKDLGIRSRYSMEEGLYRTVSQYRQYAGLDPVARPAVLSASDATS
ncbi:NAD(P)-dependent oxidoreductase [Gordonia sp. zg691]|uniref:NAD-dependent epimerase/dehydratase family protein n=1 Tax=Gordonia jinghuaiqii TaxID=2758710 RepID=UPI001662635C|nr:NAD(P)-dependent oxidoreductase [Gordonia jinghuaiqii]MBD0863457.1 NAD(P)-dependent oxidoreductase [Gordonia jinghuaiqii]